MIVVFTAAVSFFHSVVTNVSVENHPIPTEINCLGLSELSTCFST